MDFAFYRHTTSVCLKIALVFDWISLTQCFTPRSVQFVYQFYLFTSKELQVSKLTYHSWLCKSQSTIRLISKFKWKDQQIDINKDTNPFLPVLYLYNDIVTIYFKHTKIIFHQENLAKKTILLFINNVVLPSENIIFKYTVRYPRTTRLPLAECQVMINEWVFFASILCQSCTKNSIPRRTMVVMPTRSQTSFNL